ncbi:hypothetical protein Bca101_018758 [Brassica carinata]
MPLSRKKIGVLSIVDSRRGRKTATYLSLRLSETKAIGDGFSPDGSRRRRKSATSLSWWLLELKENGDISLMVALGDEGTR